MDNGIDLKMDGEEEEERINEYLLLVNIFVLI
jgi:hypothetical protein